MQQTLSVAPTQAGDNRYFVVTVDGHGNRSVDSLLFSRLTAGQKRMAQALSVPGVPHTDRTRLPR